MGYSPCKRAGLYDQRLQIIPAIARRHEWYSAQQAEIGEAQECFAQPAYTAEHWYVQANGNYSQIGGLRQVEQIAQVGYHAGGQVEGWIAQEVQSTRVADGKVF